MSNAAERGQALSNLLSNKQRDEAKSKDILAVAEGLGMKLIPERGNVYHWDETRLLKLYIEIHLDGGLKKLVVTLFTWYKLFKN